MNSEINGMKSTYIHINYIVLLACELNEIDLFDTNNSIEPVTVFFRGNKRFPIVKGILNIDPSSNKLSLQKI